VPFIVKSDTAARPAGAHDFMGARPVRMQGTKYMLPVHPGWIGGGGIIVAILLAKKHLVLQLFSTKPRRARCRAK